MIRMKDLIELFKHFLALYFAVTIVSVILYLIIAGVTLSFPPVENCGRYFLAMVPVCFIFALWFKGGLE